MSDRTSFEQSVWPPGEGEMARRSREHDWAATPLGPIERWPQSLKTAVDLVLASPFPNVLMWGREFTVCAYNDAYRPLLGDKPEALGRSFLDVWSEAREVITPQLGRALEGEATRFENAPFTLWRRNEIEQAFFDYAFSPVRDETGAVAGVLNTGIETTGRVLAERSLRESEVRFRALATAGAFLIYRMSPDWRQMRQLLGRDFLADTAEPTENWADGYLLPEDRPAIFAAIEEAIRTKSLFELEHRVRRADGSVGWVLSRAVPILGPDGEVVEWFGAGSDVTARKKAEQALRESEERLRSAFAIKTVGIMFWGPDFSLIDVNDAFLAMTGFTREEALGKTWMDLTPEEFHPASQRAVEELRTLGEITPYEKQYFRKDGQPWWGLFAGRALGNGAVEFVLDITDRKEAEAAHRKSEAHTKLLLAELQHRVRNMLGVVRSIARRTAETAESVEDYAMHLDGRIEAFARVQAVVTRNPSAGVALDMLVADTLLAVGAHEGERVRHIKGPQVRLQPKPAETFALALHELATNAVKYGALTTERGRIAVEWHFEDVGEHPRLMFHWIETGVKLSGEKPSRSGFGTELIERTLAYDLNGIARLNFTPDGLHCTINLAADGETLVEDGRPVRNS
jgi:PAS domain S-box-containing protein